MDTRSLILLVGGLGMFLLGIHHLTEGLKGLAGDTLRKALDTLVSGKWSGLLSGTIFTAVIQSSTATTLTLIGFVSAGLVTFPQAVAVILGANLGSTGTAWLVAIFGFKLDMSIVALPMVGLGSFLWLLAGGRIKATGAALAGFGLIFVGIDYMQDSMMKMEWNLTGWGEGLGARWLLALLGLVMTLVMQSSSAAGAATLVALSAGTVTLDQAFAMVIGQNIGTTGTAAFAAIGSGLAVRRTALAHILFNVLTGIPGLFFLDYFGDLSRWLGGMMGAESGVMTLAVFNTVFKLIGVAVFFPWLDAFSRFIEWITGRRGHISAVDRLDSTLAKAGGSVAMEAAWKALAELTASAFSLLKERINGSRKPAESLLNEIQQAREFIGELRFEDTAPEEFAGRRVRIWHALDHLSQLAEDLATPLVEGRLENLDEEVRQAVAALDGWVSEGGEEHVAALERGSRTFAEARRAKRLALLENIALGGLRPPEATAALEVIRWTDGALYHAWRLANSLELSSEKPRPREEATGHQEVDA